MLITITQFLQAEREGPQQFLRCTIRRHCSQPPMITRFASKVITAEKQNFLKTVSFLRERENVAIYRGIRQRTLTWSYCIWPLQAKIIIIILRHELGIDRNVPSSSNISSKVFQVVFVHLVYSSALFLPSCCCSFLLHVVVNLIYIFLVSGQLVLLFQNFFIPLWSKTVYPAVLLKNFISIDANPSFICFKGPNFAAI
jgi:hypothetical protein